MKALLSVFDKTGIEDFGKSLVDAGYELISTGGTHRSIADAGVPVTQVSDVTGSPEILEGRVKTLHPVIHGGLLARRDSPAHMAELDQHGIGPIDVVVVNLYPFVETISKLDVTLDDALENIDIGGPTMLRAAAKNFPSVAVVVDPSDYEWVAEALSGPGLDAQQRRALAAKAFQHVAVYDAAVADYLATDPTSEEEMPQQVTIGLTRVSSLRYGENPHQRGALYVPGQRRGGRPRPGHATARARTLFQQPDGRRRRLAHGERLRRPFGLRDQARQPLRPGFPRRRRPGLRTGV